MVLAGIAGAMLAGPVRAQWSPFDQSEIDPALFKIDEQRHLGDKLDGSLTFLDESGQPFALSSMAGQPLILVLSYYNCDGVCSLVNKGLADLLKQGDRLTPGEDYRVLTVSFDPRDNARSIAAFRSDLGLPAPIAAAWRFSVPSGESTVRKLSEAVGFRYLWSPRDQVFLHPGVFAFLSPDGRIMRYLYAANAGPRDVELAILEARQGQFRPSEIGDLALSLCYSYNYMDGKYNPNYPLFIGFGSLIFGIGALLTSILAYGRRVRKGNLIK